MPPYVILFYRRLQSDLYKEYIQSEDTYENDREFWRKVFKNIILENTQLSEILEVIVALVLSEPPPLVAAAETFGKSNFLS